MEGTDPVCNGNRWTCVPPSSSSRMSSSSRGNSCGPNTVLCARNTQPVCTDSGWTCRPASSSSAGTSSVHLISLRPSSGWFGTKVTIEGTGFERRNNIVLFGDSVIPRVRSLDGTHLVFRVPRHTMRPCFLQRGVRCTARIVKYEAGDYDVSVLSGNDVSNTLTFTLQ